MITHKYTDPNGAVLELTLTEGTEVEISLTNAPATEDGSYFAQVPLSVLESLIAAIKGDAKGTKLSFDPTGLGKAVKSTLTNLRDGI